MTTTKRNSQIKTSDFEAFASEVAAKIWNQLIEKPAFHALKVRDYPEVFEAVSQTLTSYRIPDPATSLGKL